jgi:hypothetical protein
MRTEPIDAPLQVRDHNVTTRRIPWWLHLLAWAGYARRFGSVQSPERLSDRGGFDPLEVVEALVELGEQGAYQWLAARKQPLGGPNVLVATRDELLAVFESWHATKMSGTVDDYMPEVSARERAKDSVDWLFHAVSKL